MELVPKNKYQQIIEAVIFGTNFYIYFTYGLNLLSKTFCLP